MEFQEELCPECGNRYMADANFCRRCGHKRGVSSYGTAMAEPIMTQAPIAYAARAAAPVTLTQQMPPVTQVAPPVVTQQLPPVTRVAPPVTQVAPPVVTGQLPPVVTQVVKAPAQVAVRPQVQLVEKIVEVPQVEVQEKYVDIPTTL